VITAHQRYRRTDRRTDVKRSHDRYIAKACSGKQRSEFRTIQTKNELVAYLLTYLLTRQVTYILAYINTYLLTRLVTYILAYINT